MNKYLENNSQQWNKLLNDEKPLNQKSNVISKRINIAYEWGSDKNSILNIGSGQGFLEERFINKLHHINWVSTDISDIGLSRLKKKFNVKTKLVSVANLNKSVGIFECIYLLEVYEHLNKKYSIHILNNLKNLLTDGGVLILSVPIYEPAPLKHHPIGHQRKFTPQTIEQEIEIAGYKIINKKYIYAFNNYYEVKALISKFMKFRRPSVIIFLCKKA